MGIYPIAEKPRLKGGMEIDQDASLVDAIPDDFVKRFDVAEDRVHYIEALITTGMVGAYVFQITGCRVSFSQFFDNNRVGRTLAVVRQ